MAHYDLNLVILSFIVTVVGAFIALIVMRDALLRPSDSRRGLIALAALCLGGVAIWSMHFMGILAFDRDGIAISYNLWLMAFSFYIGVGAVYVGLTIIAIDEFKIGAVISTGILVGMGVAGMYYSSLLSMQIQADAHWNWGVAALSLVIAITACIIALWLAVYVSCVWQMLIGAMLLGGVVCAMHYTVMAAVEFVYNPALPAVNAINVTALVFSLSIATLDMLVVVLAIAQSVSEANQRKFSAL